jgi:hypothetical protein
MSGESEMNVNEEEEIDEVNEIFMNEIEAEDVVDMIVMEEEEIIIIIIIIMAEEGKNVQIQVGDHVNKNHQILM